MLMRRAYDRDGSPRSEHVAADPDDEGADHDDEEDPDEPGAAGDRDARTDVRPDQVGGSDDHGDLPEDTALRHEEEQRPEVGRPVGELGLGGRVEEVVAEQADEGEDEE